MGLAILHIWLGDAAILLVPYLHYWIRRDGFGVCTVAGAAIAAALWPATLAVMVAID